MSREREKSTLALLQLEYMVQDALSTVAALQVEKEKAKLIVQSFSPQAAAALD